MSTINRQQQQQQPQTTLDLTSRTATSPFGRDMSSGKVNEYGWKTDLEVSSDPIPVLKGEVDTVQQIAAYYPQTDLKTMLKRVEANDGDLSLLQAKPGGQYGDFSEMPHDIFEAQAAASGNAAAIAQMAKMLGIDSATLAGLNADQVQTLFDSKIKSIIASEQAAKSNQEGEANK